MRPLVQGFDGRYYPDAVQVSDPSTLLSWDYTVDKVGNVTSIADTLVAAGNLTQIDRSGNVLDFTWDEAGRLQRAERSAADEAVSFTYDGRSFLSLAAEDADPPPPESLPFSDGFESGDLSAWSSCVGGSGCGPTVRSVLPTYSSEGLLYALGDESGYASVFYFSGRPVAQVDTSGPDPEWTFLTTDHLGTPIFAADFDGTELWQGGFEPFGEDYTDAQGMGIFLRLPGQWEDPVWQAATDGAPLYYNVHRWYEYGTGRYTRVDPLGLGGGIHPFAYARGNPLNYFDPLGQAYFAKRPFKNHPWYGPGSCNPIDDYLNTELSHEQLFFEDGGSPSNLGFFKNNGGELGEDNPQGYRYRCRSRRFNDCIMREAVEQTPVQPYCLLGKPGAVQKSNCQDWAERTRDKYQQLEKDPKTRERCGCD